MSAGFKQYLFQMTYEEMKLYTALMHASRVKYLKNRTLEEASVYGRKVIASRIANGTLSTAFAREDEGYARK
jgi:hypothetical protein